MLRNTDNKMEMEIHLSSLSYIQIWSDMFKLRVFTKSLFLNEARKDVEVSAEK